MVLWYISGFLYGSIDLGILWDSVFEIKFLGLGVRDPKVVSWALVLGFLYFRKYVRFVCLSLVGFYLSLSLSWPVSTRSIWVLQQLPLACSIRFYLVYAFLHVLCLLFEFILVLDCTHCIIVNYQLREVLTWMENSHSINIFFVPYKLILKSKSESCWNGRSTGIFQLVWGLIFMEIMLKWLNGTDRQIGLTALEHPILPQDDYQWNRAEWNA